jgi:hypothetical protein
MATPRVVNLLVGFNGVQNNVACPVVPAVNYPVPFDWLLPEGADPNSEFGIAVQLSIDDPTLEPKYEFTLKINSTVVFTTVSNGSVKLSLKVSDKLTLCAR